MDHRFDTTAKLVRGFRYESDLVSEAAQNALVAEIRNVPRLMPTSLAVDGGPVGHRGPAFASLPEITDGQASRGYRMQPIGGPSPLRSKEV
jgi:hypothetical protein